MGDVLGSIGDALTFDVFDFDGSRDRDPVNITVPGPSAQEQKLLNLQIASLEQQLAGPTEEEQALLDRNKEYLESMLSDEVLSEDEEAQFNEAYELELSALNDQFDMDTERLGASRMAELAGRGVLGTTTGDDIIARDQQSYTDTLGANISQLGMAKDIARSDMELAKKEMAQQGYRLTSGLLQNRTSDALSQAGMTQNYLTSQNVMTANAALSSALMNQQWEQYGYNQRMGGAAQFVGLGQSMIKQGAKG